jgi:hypothetical protein
MLHRMAQRPDSPDFLLQLDGQAHPVIVQSHRIAKPIQFLEGSRGPPGLSPISPQEAFQITHDDLEQY